MLVLSGLATTTRWLLFPVMTSVPGYLVLQSLHALTFACGHLAMMRLIVTRVPDRSAATVQGLYATVGSLTMAAATLAAGPLYRNYGGHGFQIMSLIALAGVCLVLTWVPLRRQATFDLA
jgi:PPP family 3-phenylpropionic acid transporter